MSGPVIGPGETPGWDEPVTTAERFAASDFGPNEWLVHEIYQQYLSDPDSVDPAWHDFFADYPTPVPEDGTRGRAAPAAGAVAAPYVLERMTDHGFRRWTRLIIFSIAAVYLVRGGLLMWRG